jgi:UDP-N-acetylmuramate--alanine ligase
VVFHPHTYTRTKALFSDFSNSFDLADELIILDIYGSAREKQGGVSSLELARAIKKNNKEKKIEQKILNLKEIKDVSLYLKKTTKKDDLILLMGAGDVFRVADSLLKIKK